MAGDQSEKKDLQQAAKAVLELNWTGHFTKPAQHMYPHQWAWDAGFIAIGEVHYNQKRAQRELRHLFKGQWKNGMVPHIVFNEDKSVKSYFPGSDFWKTERSSNAPQSINTSGICQPPVLATAIRHILDYAEDKEAALAFAEELYPKLKAWHDFLYRERDPDNERLVYIRHPWESGQDNSPAFDDPLDNIQSDSDQIPDYKREDLNFVDRGQRPSDSNYDRFIYLVDFFRKRNYDEKRIRRDGCPVMIQDALFNALLCRAGQDLAEIAERLSEDPKPIRQRANKTADAINKKLWNEEQKIYFDFDLKAGKQVESHELSGFLPFFAGIPDEAQAERMFDYLNTADFCRLDEYSLAVPSFDRRESGYSPTTYWRGPIWINLNWMLWEGLRQYGYDDYAQKVKNTIYALVETNGFHEYFDPDTGEGYGADQFSWTASLFLDIWYRDEKET